MGGPILLVGFSPTRCFGFGRANGFLFCGPTLRILNTPTGTPQTPTSSTYPTSRVIAGFRRRAIAPCGAFGLTPHLVINLNSLLCWRVFQRFGSRLSFSTSLYSCVFCSDILPSGERVDSPQQSFLRRRLVLRLRLLPIPFPSSASFEVYAIPEKLQSKIVPLMMPARLPLRTPSVARLAAQATMDPEKRIVAWAGRLDRQKRFDLVQKVATLMPDTQFHCWGKPLVDPFVDISESPPNITMHPPFSSHDEIPLSTVGAWLFTSGWEGMPNTIVEAATLDSRLLQLP